MNYKGWNDLICDYFVSRSRTQLILHISIGDLIDYAKEVDVEIANGKGAGLYKSDDLLITNFTKNFWVESSKGPVFCNPTLTQLKYKINSLRKEFLDAKDYKSCVSLLAILIMPICDEGTVTDVSAANYRTHLFSFLKKYKFVLSTEHSTNFLQEIGLMEIWNAVQKWAASEGLCFNRNIEVARNGAILYANSLLNESLLRPSHIQRLGQVFYKAGFVPDSFVSDERLYSAFCNHYPETGLSTGHFKVLKSDDFKDYMISILREQYARWDGTVRNIEKVTASGRIRVSGGTRCPLLLVLSIPRFGNKVSAGLWLYCQGIEPNENHNFVAKSGSEFSDVSFRYGGYAESPFMLPDEEMEGLLSSTTGEYELTDVEDKSFIARFMPSDYYLLRLYRGYQISTSEFIKGEFYFVLVRKSEFDSYKEWLTQNDAEPVMDNLFGEQFGLYRIQKAKVSLPSMDDKYNSSLVRCSYDQNIQVQCETTRNCVALSDMFPAKFKISGIDISEAKVYARSYDSEGKTIAETKLEYDHESQFWKLNVFTSTFLKDECFDLFYDEMQIPRSPSFRFMTFKNPSTFKKLPLNAFGELAGETDCFSDGLKLPASAVNDGRINWESMGKQMLMAPYHEIFSTEYSDKEDFLLYAITSASGESSFCHIKRKWINMLLDTLTDVGQYTFQDFLAEYFRMGYINFCYDENRYKIVANPPTLVLLDPEFKREQTVFEGRYTAGAKTNVILPLERRYKCLLTGGRNPELVDKVMKLQSHFKYKVEIVKEDNALLPQRIYIYADQTSSFSGLAEKLNLCYQDTVYSLALLNGLPSVGQYEEHIFNTHPEIEYRTDHVSYLAMDYTTMTENNEKNHPIQQDDFVHFYPKTRNSDFVYIKDGVQRSVDKYWGHFLAMRQQKAIQLDFDESLMQISMPSSIRLPLLYARALTLLTGKTPVHESGRRYYNMVTNPLSWESEHDMLLNKLEQTGK